MPNLSEDDRELKTKKVQVHMLVKEDSLQALLLRYSSLYKLLTSVAWLLRFKNHLRRQSGQVRTGGQLCWTQEYLPMLQVKQKLLRPRPNLSVGDLVLVIGKNSLRAHWPKGVVHEVSPDRHGNVRQVTVRTSTSVLRRDVRKLCLLEGASKLKAERKP